MASCIGTWAFSNFALIKAQQLLTANSTSLDALEEAIALIEGNPEMGVHFIGCGGAPNSEGVIQCDAAMMDGKELKFGAVASLEGITSPIRVARCVLEKSRHSMIVGAGAQQFAISEGFCIEQLMPTTRMDVTAQQPVKSHDTMGLIARDRMGNITVDEIDTKLQARRRQGVSTSGLVGKHPGRVGDSPIPGAGLYADNELGAACATGDGDDILKYCPSYHVVQLMSRDRNLSPTDACTQVIRDIYERRRRCGQDMIQGECGAGGYVKPKVDGSSGVETSGFPYCSWREGDTVPTLHCVDNAV